MPYPAANVSYAGSIPGDTSELKSLSMLSRNIQPTLLVVVAHTWLELLDEEHVLLSSCVRYVEEGGTEAVDPAWIRKQGFRRLYVTGIAYTRPLMQPASRFVQVAGYAYESRNGLGSCAYTDLYCCAAASGRTTPWSMGHAPFPVGFPA